MAPARKILLADPDPEALRALAPALRRCGYQVHGARDASRALQIAILRFPDLVLLDEASPVLEARTFMRLLRTNPRTEHIPVVLTGLEPDAERSRLGTYLQKPFDVEEVLARVEQLLRRQDASRVVSGEGREIEGNLAQIPLVDLLQILTVNRKTGRLTLEREGERAAIVLREGRVIDAGAGRAGGEKALFRLLTRREGQFAFVPGHDATPERIERKVDELVLEGLRQADEVARLLPGLPQPGDVIELAVHPSEIPAGLHPVTEEVVALLERPLAFQDLVDRCRASDLEAMRATAALLEHGYARCREGAADEPRGELLAPHELHALRARIARGRSSGAQTVGKVVVAGGGPLARRAALARFEALPGFTAEAEAYAGGFGTLGRLALGEGVQVDLTGLPGDAGLLPLWRPFAAGAVGALVLLPADGMDALLVELSRVLRLPVVVCGPKDASLPEVLHEAPGGCAFEGSDAAEGLRALLAGAGARAAGY